MIKKYQREIHDLKEELQQLKRGIMENPNTAVSSQEDLVNLKLQVCAVANVLKCLRRLLPLGGQPCNMRAQYVMFWFLTH